jgi:ufm1-conjugating enzyme 1
MDERTKTTVSKIPLLTVRASPRDGDAWTARLKEELTALIKYVQNNKEQDKDWFHIECNPHGTRWSGRCWYFYDQIRYEFDLEFDIPVTYPAAAPELKLPQLDGLTSKMYRGGKICQTLHFQPLWARNVPSMGVAHCLALSVSCSQLKSEGTCCHVSTLAIHLLRISFLSPAQFHSGSSARGWLQKSQT